MTATMRSGADLAPDIRRGDAAIADPVRHIPVAVSPQWGCSHLCTDTMVDSALSHEYRSSTREPLGVSPYLQALKKETQCRFLECSQIAPTFSVSSTT